MEWCNYGVVGCHFSSVYLCISLSVHELVVTDADLRVHLW